jgi:heme exporter protein D
MDFSFTDYMWIKAIAIVAVVAVVNFIYTLITGKSIEEVLRERRGRAEDQSAQEQQGGRRLPDDSKDR